MKIKDSSEIKEAINIFHQMKIEELKPEFVEHSTETRHTKKLFSDTEEESLITLSQKVFTSTPVTREQRLEKVLSDMCDKYGCHGALVADGDGLSLTSWNTPASTELLASLASYLGKGIERAHKVLPRQRITSFKIDMNGREEILLYPFVIHEQNVYLMVFRPASGAAIMEVSDTIDEIISLLSK